ncbi:MAG TPA: hypothetical protein VEA19_03080 [Actinomycetota bacterium]|nr:hypothetical protein [Actinomycetota bacterium]
MPESYGKRQRGQIKAKKANAREERRVARNKRRADGSDDPESWLGEPPTPVADEPQRTPPPREETR